jgi:hypothetical protein
MDGHAWCRIVVERMMPAIIFRRSYFFAVVLAALDMQVMIATLGHSTVIVAACGIVHSIDTEVNGRLAMFLVVLVTWMSI